MTVRELVFEGIKKGNVGPDDVTAYVLKNLNGTDRQALFEQMLRDFVRQIIGEMRRRTPRSGKDNVSHRWASAAEAVRSRQYEIPGKEWKRLDDMTPEECEEMAAGYSELAAENAAMASRFGALAEAIRKSRRATVAGLSDKRVLEIMGD